MEARRPARRFTVVVASVAVPSAIAVVALAARQAAAGETVLGSFGPLVEAAIAFGGWLLDTAQAWTPRLRWPLVAVGVALLGLAVARRSARGGVAPWAAALALGMSAQAFLLAGSVALGVALYAGSVAAVALAPTAPAAPRSTSELREGAVLLALMAVFAVLCLHRIEVDPNLYFDEIAYLRAARMFAGQIEVGRILGSPEYEIYVYDQFAAQTIPLALQAASVRVLASDVVATRLVSFLAAGAGLLGAALLLRPRLGFPAVAWMLAFAVSAPLVVIYSRAGHYIAVSLLHSVVSFGCLLWLWRRWDPASALATGLLLGASLYQYQLSWFVPVFAALAFAVSPGLWRRSGVLRVVGCVAGGAIVAAAPAGLWLDAGLAAVNAQTFDRAVWSERGGSAAESGREVIDHVVVIAPAPLEAADRTDLDERLARADLTRRHFLTTDGEAGLWITGAPENVAEITRFLRGVGWTTMEFDWHRKDPLVRLRAMLRFLFYERSFESSGRWIDAPLLNPLLAPLLVLGIATAWRRRSEPAVRLLLVWVLAGAVLPAIAGGPMPRRVVLMLPFAQALMALPLVALGAQLRRGGAATRGAAGLLACVWLAAVTSTGVHLYYREWQHQAGRIGGGGELIHLVKLLKSRPADERVLMPALFSDMDAYLEAGSATLPIPVPEMRKLETLPALAVLARSCAENPPFTWIFRDVPAQRLSSALLEANFTFEAETREGFRVLRVHERIGPLCRQVPSGLVDALGKPPDQSRGGGGGPTPNNGASSGT